MPTTEYLRTSHVSPVGVDREKRVINGYVVAEAGPFKTGRGSFDGDSLTAIANLMNSDPDGVVVNYGHQPDPGASSALDAFLGMAKNARVDGAKVRADLHLSDVSKDLGDRVMSRAESHPKSFGSSLVVSAEKVRMRSGPPLWRPLAIQSSDLVYIGDAVHGGILAADDAEGQAADDAEGQAEEDRLRWRNKKRKAAC